MAHRPLDLTPERYRAGDRPYAVVDIGSNSVRMVIYDRLGRAPFPRFNEKSLCRLGAGLAETGRLDPEAIARTVRTLERFRAIAEAMGVGRVDVIATEATRRATNGATLLDGIREATGFEVRVLEGNEEAWFGALGVMSGFYRPRGIIGDIGGGSVDIGEVADDQVGERATSLPLGTLPVSELVARCGRAAKKEIDEALEGNLPPLLAGRTFYAVGGGWRALAAIHMAETAASVDVVHAYEVPGEEMRKFAKRLSRLEPDEIAALPGVPSRRQDTTAAAALVLERILKALKPDRIIFSVYGVREGWLFGQLEKDTQYHDPLLDGAQAFAYDNSRVPEFAAALDAWTAELFPGETTEERRLRVAACALSDVAWRDHPSSKALQTYRRLLVFPFVGVTHAERAFLAAVIYARYGGKVADQALKPAIDLVTPADQRRSEILGRAIRLGYRFAGCVPETLAASRLVITAESVQLEIRRDARVPDSDAVLARAKLLAKSLGLPDARTVTVEG